MHVIAQAEGTGPATAETRGEGPVLSLEHISKTYPGTRALIDVSFDLHAGEVHCLIGENGAGKSTLMKILAGVVRPDEGAVRIAGEPHDHLTPRSALALGVSTIYQDADIVTSLTVADNIFLGKEPTSGAGIVDSGHQRRVVRELVEDLGVRLDPECPRVRPVPRRASAHDDRARPQLRARGPRPRRAHRLARPERDRAPAGAGAPAGREGSGHHLHLALPRGGPRGRRSRHGAQGWPLGRDAAGGGVHPDGLVRLMVGRDASAFFVKETVEIGEVRLRAEGLSGRGVAEPASFEVRGGEVLGFGGLVGAGRTELMELVFGVGRRGAGQLVIDGRTVGRRAHMTLSRRASPW